MGEERRKEPESGEPPHYSMQRVKVYRLNDEGKWDDRGTGHVTIDYIEGSKELGLTVIDEEDSETLLVHNITSEDIYRKQEETIISWRDPEAAIELALSFQEVSGCSYIWETICEIQRSLQFSNLGALEVGPRPALQQLEASRILHPNEGSFRSVNSELRELPPVELSSLPLILKTVLECGITDQIRLAELISQDHEFFPKLVELFRMCEDLENLDGLHMIFRLVKGIVLLNSSSIFDKIFSDEFILDMIGALEYDPEVPKLQKHRAFLKEHVVFKEAIPIKNAHVVSKIHQTYRIGYLKDVILPRILDDATLASLNTITHANNAVVISLLKDDACFIQELFARMRSSNISSESKRELVLFLHEFCTLSKSLQLVQQLRLFRDLANEGVFQIISDVLQSQDKKLISAGADILILFLNQDPNLLRSYIIEQEGNALLGLLVKGMVTDFGEEMHSQFLEILRILMDSFTMSGAHRETITEIFCERHLDHLVDVIASSCPPWSISQSAPNSAVGSVEAHATKPEILTNICELLCFCVVHHPYRIKCNFLMNNAIEKILTLTQRREKFLVVAAVRFMRNVISKKDEHLIRHVVKFNLLKPVIESFVENGYRYNMLHSGVLELLEYIKKENIKPLITYVFESFWDKLVKFERLGSIQAFKLKYQQSLESAETKLSSSVVDISKRSEERGLEKEEEDYFNEDSDEEDSARRTTPAHEDTMAKLANGREADHASTRPKSGGLVDYDDDDDDDYNPPPKRPVRADEDDDEALKIPMVKRKPGDTGDGKHTDGEVPKRKKLEARISCAKIAAVTSSTGKHMDLQNKPGPLSPSSSIPSFEDNGDSGEEKTGPEDQQHAPENPDSTQKSGGDCTNAAGSLSQETVVNTTKATESESYSVR